MKRKNWLYAVLLIVMIILIAACAPRVVKERPAPGDDLFNRAESLFNKGDYYKAFDTYESYLAKYPEGIRAPAAMMKTGVILSVKGDYEAARTRYNMLLSRFPESPFVEDARISILVTWYNQKAYEKVLDYAQTIDDKTVSDDCVARKYAVVGDAYDAMGRPMDAAYVFISALRKVDKDNRSKILIKLDQVTSAMPPDSLQSLLSGIRDLDYRGYLTCLLGEKYMKREAYDRAVAVLSGFIDQFPENRYAEKARHLLGSIEKESLYDRYAVGCVLPLSGKYKVFGEQALNGIELAFREFLTAQTGREKRPAVRLAIRDSGSDKTQAVAAVKSLIEAERVAAIIGPLITSESAILEAQKRHVPIIALTQEQDIPAIGDYVFRNFLTPDMQVQALVDYTVETLGMSRFAVLYPDEAYGRVFAHKFWDYVIARDAEIVGFEAYNPRETDFAGPIRKLVGLYYDIPEELKPAITAYRESFMAPYDEEAPETPAEEPAAEEDRDEPQEKEEEETEKAVVDFDAIFVPDGPSNAGLILPQLAYYDIVDTLFVGTNLWHSDQLPKIAGRYAEGAVMPTGFWESSGYHTVQSFCRSYRDAYDAAPSFIPAVAYDSAVILFDIIADPDVRYRSSIRNRLGMLKDFPGVTGMTAFDETGEVHKKLPLLKIRRRQFESVTIIQQHQENNG
ncbi:MAG: penicillin-binding protein activator [Thermodesulfobacteriota bacterium]|nr:penicillin-binding protein activator [Thermodesulfobacteriota bacterium]